MSDKEHNTEALILSAARKVFLQKGFDGARMQEIADEAGINKALLHYYFRSKEKLFETVFKEAFGKMIPKIADAFNNHSSLKEMLETFVENYISILIENPFIPPFIISEINRNPKAIFSMMQNIGIQPNMIITGIQKILDREKITQFSAPHLLTNLIALCVFPFVSRPLLQEFLFQNQEDEFIKFLEERKKTIPLFILNSLNKNAL